METFNLIIAGDSHFEDYLLLKTKVDDLLRPKIAFLEVVIVSNPRKGAAFLGERYAAEMGYEVAEFLGNEEENGKSTLFTINRKMVELADACICFWDGKCNSCRHLIALVNAAAIPLTMVIY